MASLDVWFVHLRNECMKLVLLFSPKRLRNLLQVDFLFSVTQLKASAFHQSQFDIYNAAVDFTLSPT